KPEEVLDDDASVPSVVLLGSNDGARAMQELRGLLDRFEGVFEITDAVDVGADVVTLHAGGETIAHLVARPGFLGFAGDDEQSIALLRAVLATKGKSTPPKVYRDRMTDDKLDAAPMMMSAQHVLSDLQSKLMAKELQGKLPPTEAVHVLVEVLSKVL